MKLRTGDKVEFNREVATVLEHTDKELILLIGDIDDVNEVKADIKKVTLYIPGSN